MEDLKIKKSRVLAAAQKGIVARELMEALFPEAFEENKVFCKVGDLLKWECHPTFVFTVACFNGLLRMVNVSSDCVPVSASIPLAELADQDGEVLTVKEFSSMLIGYAPEDFRVIDTSKL